MAKSSVIEIGSTTLSEGAAKVARASAAATLRDLGDEALALHALIDWCNQARVLIESTRSWASVNTRLEDALHECDIRFRSADWNESEAHSGMTYLLMHQQSLIQQMVGVADVVAEVQS